MKTKHKKRGFWKRLFGFRPGKTDVEAMANRRTNLKLHLRMLDAIRYLRRGK